MQRFQSLIRSWTVLTLVLFASWCQAEIRLVDTPGLGDNARYAVVRVSSGVFFAVQLSEETGFSSGNGNYVANDAAILAAAPDATLADGDYIVTPRAGDYTSPNDDDEPKGSGTLHWLSNAEVPINLSSNISPFLVDKDQTWTFDSKEQITSATILVEGKSPRAVKAVDLSEPITEFGSLSAIVSVSIADVNGATEPTITSSALDTTKKKIVLTFNCQSATAGTYTITLEFQTIDNQIKKRKVQLKIQ